MATVSEQIQEIYIGLLGRAADKSGLDYWTAEINAGTLTIEQLRANIVNEQPEYAAGLGSMTRAQTVNELYNRLFERAAETDGLEYWVNGAGASVNVDQLVLALSAGASAADKLVLDNKTDAAEYYTANITTYTADSAKAAVDSVDGTSASVDTSKASTDGNSQTAGQTFTLTTAIDVLTGTSSDDTVIGDAGTASAADTLDLGAGTDTVRIVGGAGTTDIPTLTNVEVLELIGNTGNTDVSSVSDLTSLVLDNSTTGLIYTQSATAATTVKNMADGENVTLTYAAADTTSTINLDKVGTTADVTVNADGAGLATVNVATANNKSFVDLDSTGSIKTVNVTGDQDLTLNLQSETTITTLDASAATGKITSDLGASAAAVNVKGGTNNDTLTVDAAVNSTVDAGAGDDVVIVGGNLDTNDSIAGGEGTDTIGMTSTEAAASDADTNVTGKLSGFEQVRITDDLGDDFAISGFGSNYLQLADDVATDQTVSGFTSGATVELRDATDMTADLTVGMTGATGAGTDSDTLNLFMNANLSNNDSINYDFDVEGINIININAVDRVNTDAATNKDDGYVVSLDGNTNNNNANVKTVNIEGSSSVTYTVDAGATALSTVEGNASTGNLILDASAFAGTQGVKLVTGAGNDQVTAAAGLADVFTTGTGRDIISVSNDGTTGTVVLDSTTTTFDKVTDFAVTTEAMATAAVANVGAFAAATAGGANVDILDLTLEEAGGTQDLTANVVANAVDTNVAAAVTQATTLTASVTNGIMTVAGADSAVVDTLAEWVAVAQAMTSTDSDALAFEFNSNTYVFATPDASVAATDMLIELTGVTGVNELSDVAGASVAGTVLIG